MRCKSGSRVRARCVLLKVEEVTGGLQLTEQYTVEIEGEAEARLRRRSDHAGVFLTNGASTADRFCRDSCAA